MGEAPEPLTSNEAETSISNASILKWMGVAIAIAAIIGTIAMGVRFGLGIVLGGGVAYANYFWLRSSMRSIFAGGSGASMAAQAAKYILRYAAIGAVLLLIYLTDVLPVAAVIIGTAAFAFAVVAAGMKSIFNNSF